MLLPIMSSTNTEGNRQTRRLNNRVTDAASVHYDSIARRKKYFHVDNDYSNDSSALELMHAVDNVFRNE